jgi:effector-binding domain-containing protein
MIDTPHLTESTAEQSAVIHVTVRRAEVETVMDGAIHELMSTLAVQGIPVAGPMYSYHLRLDPEVFDFELGLPVATPVAPTGRVRPGELPARRVVRTVYHGPYEGLGAAWGEFGSWIEENGLPTGPDFWERYLAGPESSADPADWRTELNRSLTA